MRSNRNTPALFWEADRDAALAEARNGGCALSLWFTLAQQREKRWQELSAWLKDVHAKCLLRAKARIEGVAQ